MNTTRKLCPIHNIPMAKSVLVGTKQNQDGVNKVRKWIDVQYYCHACKAAERIKKLKAGIKPST